MHWITDNIKQNYETKQQTCTLTLLYYNFNAFDAKSKYSSQSRSKLSGRIGLIVIYRITGTYFRLVSTLKILEYLYKQQFVLIMPHVP